MTKPISREYRIYLALWRKAYLTGEPITIKTRNLAIAVAMRQGMYRAIRPFRDGTSNDYELQNAAEKYVIFIVRPEDKSREAPHFIEFRKRQTLNELNNMWDDLGIDEEDLLIGEERLMQQSVEKIMKNIGSPNKKKSSAKTPFYERD